jgi:alpha-pyrone synthase
MPANITAIGIANPLYQRSQHDIAELIVNCFQLKPSQKRLLTTIYKNSGIDTRYSVIDDYSTTCNEFSFFPKTPNGPLPTTAKRMQYYKQSALPLALHAIENCLASIQPFDLQTITHIITISCTGMYAPGIDIEIIQSLKLPSSIKRTAINFMGCYGAFNGMKVAEAFCNSDANASVLMVCVELCSLHFQNNFSHENLIANAIFADGAAALLIQKNPKTAKSLAIDAFHCDLIAQSQQQMAWHIADYGFDMVLSSYVPDMIKLGIADFIAKFFKQIHSNHRQQLDYIDFYAIHPGGIKILQACEQALNITTYDNRFSYEILRRYGNMSSATIIFVLKYIWDNLTNTDNLKKIFSCAFGPGLTLEAMLLTIHC